MEKDNLHFYKEKTKESGEHEKEGILVLLVG
jgi:hypothetical protein